MKGTGIIRMVDDLGRVVIPKEIRTHFNIGSYDPVEIYVEADAIIIKPFDERTDIDKLLQRVANLIGENPKTYNQKVLLSKVSDMRKMLKEGVKND